MKTDDIRRGQKGVKVHPTAVRARVDGRVGKDHFHTEGLSYRCNAGANVAEPHQAQCTSFELDASQREAVFCPDPVAGLLRCQRQLATQR
ncbi:hypothetical protein D3C80_1412180 [compost metagenome]